MSDYRLSKLREQHLKLQEDAAEYKITPGNDVGTAKPKDKKEEFLSNILARLNELFVTDNLTDKDMINYAFAVRDKLSENQAAMTRIANNTREQVMQGDFPKAIDGQQRHPAGAGGVSRLWIAESDSQIFVGMKYLF